MSFLHISAEIILTHDLTTSSPPIEEDCDTRHILTLMFVFLKAGDSK